MNNLSNESLILGTHLNLQVDKLTFIDLDGKAIIINFLLENFEIL